MKKIVSVIVFLIVVGNSFGQIQQDKVLHFLGGNLFGLAGAGIASHISNEDRTWTFIGAVTGSLLVGIAKESIDESQYGGWDNTDLLTTVLGGVTVGATIDIFKQKKKRKQARLLKEAIGYQPMEHSINRSLELTTTSLKVMAISRNVLYRD